MADDTLPIVFDEGGELFESLGEENGKRTWSARRFMKALGYSDWSAFKKIIQKSMAACNLLGIDIFKHFVPKEAAGKNHEDYRLTRFACGMVAVNCDPSNANVAAAQAFFVSLWEMIAEHGIEHAASIDRFFARDEISEREITLRETAAAAGVESFPGFQTAGYEAMYDMPYWQLRELRGVSKLPKRSVLDFMGKDELAGNLFRLSLTEGRIKKERTRGQGPLESIASEVGRRVRRMMIEDHGLAPEQLPTAQDIRQLKKGIKRVVAEIAPIDDLETHRKLERQVLDDMLPEISNDAVDGCSECAGGNPAPHFGSRHCTSGSLASGGNVPHCQCNDCY